MDIRRTGGPLFAFASAMRLKVQLVTLDGRGYWKRDVSVLTILRGALVFFTYCPGLGAKSTIDPSLNKFLRRSRARIAHFQLQVHRMESASAAFIRHRQLRLAFPGARAINEMT